MKSVGMVLGVAAAILLMIFVIVVGCTIGNQPTRSDVGVTVVPSSTSSTPRRTVITPPSEAPSSVPTSKPVTTTIVPTTSVAPASPAPMLAPTAAAPPAVTTTITPPIAPIPPPPAAMPVARPSAKTLTADTSHVICMGGTPIYLEGERVIKVYGTTAQLVRHGANGGSRLIFGGKPLFEFASAIVQLEGMGDNCGYVINLNGRMVGSTGEQALDFDIDPTGTSDPTTRNTKVKAIYLAT